MGLSDLLINVLPIHLFELLAASVGTYYIKVKKEPIKSSKYLVVFLWVTFFVDVFGEYASVAYYSEYEIFGFIEETRFRKSDWVYNIMSVVSLSFYSFYFRSYLINKWSRKMLKGLVVAFIFSSIVNWIFSTVFFDGFSRFTLLSGTLLLFLSSVLFHFELLKSDKILNFKEYLPVYVSVGSLVFFLCITPIKLFHPYFNSGHALFDILQSKGMLVANILMYIIFTLGFIVCARKT